MASTLRLAARMVSSVHTAAAKSMAAKMNMMRGERPRRMSTVRKREKQVLCFSLRLLQEPWPDNAKDAGRLLTGDLPHPPGRRGGGPRSLQSGAGAAPLEDPRQ